MKKPYICPALAAIRTMPQGMLATSQVNSISVHIDSSSSSGESTTISGGSAMSQHSIWENTDWNAIGE